MGISFNPSPNALKASFSPVRNPVEKEPPSLRSSAPGSSSVKRDSLPILNADLLRLLGEKAKGKEEAISPKPDWSKEISILPGDHLFRKLRLATKKKLENLEYEPNVKSRYSGIQCPEATCISIQSLDSDKVHYLHANWVGLEVLTRKIIAAQAPIEENEPIFWEYLLDNPANILDLTSLNDFPFHFSKAANCLRMDFYPDPSGFFETFHSVINKERILGIKASGVGKLQAMGTSVRAQDSSFEIQDVKTKKTTHIRRHNFLGWPDHGVVSVEDLKNLVEKTKELGSDPNRPLLIHCMAGVGRTGCVVTAIALEQEISSGKITLDNVDASLVNLIFAFRKERGPYFVINEKQFNLLREYAYLLLKEKEAQ